MKLRAAGRIVGDIGRRRLRELYYEGHARMVLARRLARRENRAFGREVLHGQLQFLTGHVRPVSGQTRERMRAAVEWLYRAQDATPDDGVSVGYFPAADPGRRWKPSYPETTGYIIVSLLDYAERYGDEEARRRALRMGIWEAVVQMPSGAVQAGPLCSPDMQAPAVFNTGMVLQGFVALLIGTGDQRFLEPARRAADFLLGDLGEDGHFRTHGPFVTPDRVKTYNSLCAWPLYRFGEYAGDDRYTAAAIRAAEAAVREQMSNGWFRHNCLDRPEAPLLHTIGYTLQGLTEVGLLAKRDDFLDAARRGVEPLIARIAPEGFLHGRFYADWEPACFSACLTGMAQLAIVCCRLHEIAVTGRYVDAANRLIDFLKAVTARRSDDPSIVGALAGSYPILGTYMSGGYPNWATKYLLDALMLQDRLSG